MTELQPLSAKQIKVALIYDRVNAPYGGAEQVLLALQQLFPDAPLFTSIYQEKKALWAKQFTVIPSFLNNIPLAKTAYRWFLPLMPLAFESLDLSAYQLIISVTSAEAKGVITQPNQTHVGYLLTPPRYLYDFKTEYIQALPLFKCPIVKFLIQQLLAYVKWWDQAAISRPDVIIPLSKLVQTRVKNIYHLATGSVIYPPIDVINLASDDQSLTQFSLPQEFLLVVSRLVPYKRLDLAISASYQLKQNLVIVGEGPELTRLKRQARQLAQTHQESRIYFLPTQPQSIVNALIKKAKLFLAPGIDDFGLSPLQANLMGTPAIINAHSGVAEVFQAGIQGEKMSQSSSDALVTSLQKALSTTYNSAKMKNYVSQYNTNKFLHEFANVLQPFISQYIN